MPKTMIYVDASNILSKGKNMRRVSCSIGTCIFFASKKCWNSNWKGYSTPLILSIVVQECILILL